MYDSSPQSSDTLWRQGSIKVASGNLIGAAAPEAESISRYLGIPYAAPPIEELRWCPPQPVLPWLGVRETTEFGPAPLQPIDSTLAMFGIRDGDRMSEDCLTLNIWTPVTDAGEKRPVMVWIHGGGFRIGHAGHRMYNGVRLAERGVLVVSMNYRLNMAGGLAHPLLTAESAQQASGNYSLMDQIAALQWIRDNIAAFGGDPDNVTLFGESAGGRSISVLMASPLAKDLFHRGICQSGALRDTGQPLQEREAQGVQVARTLGCEDLASLRNADGQTLAEAADIDSNPFVDGFVIPDTPETLYRSGNIHNKSLLIGTNANEAGLFALHLKNSIRTAKSFHAVVEAEFGAASGKILEAYTAKTDADAQSAWNALRTDMWFTLPARNQSRWMEACGRETYLYCFSRIPPWRGGGAMGAHHGAEIPYVFGGGVRCGAFAAEGADDRVDRNLSDIMMSYWANFATTGDPNGDGLSEWSPYSSDQEAYMHFGDTTEQDHCLFRDRLDVLEEALVHHSGQSNIYGE